MSSLEDLIDLEEIIAKDLNPPKLQKGEGESRRIEVEYFCISQVEPLFYDNHRECMLCKKCASKRKSEHLQNIINWHALLKNLRRPLSIYCNGCLNELVRVKPAIFCLTCSHIACQGILEGRFSKKYETYHIHSCTYLTKPWETEPIFPILQNLLQKPKNHQLQVLTVHGQNI